MDGNGTGIVIVPVMGNFLLKVYKQDAGEEPFGNIVKALLELASFLNKN